MDHVIMVEGPSDLSGSSWQCSVLTLTVGEPGSSHFSPGTLLHVCQLQAALTALTVTVREPGSREYGPGTL